MRVVALLIGLLLVGQAPPQRDSHPRHALYRTRDFGRTWTPVDSGLPQNLQVSLLEPWGRKLLIGTESHGLFLGVPGSGEWTTSGDKLPSPKITALHAARQTLYAGVYEQGIFASHDAGRSWRSLNRGLADLRVRAILEVETGLLVGTDTGLFLQRRRQPAWTHVFSEGQIVSLDRSGRRIVGGGAFGAVLSEDEGSTWRWIHKQGAAHNTAILDERIVLMNISGDLFLSNDWGAAWTAQTYGPREGSYVYDVVGAGSRLVASNNYGIHASADGGLHWEHVYKTEDLIFMDLVAMDGHIYGGTRDWGERRARIYSRERRRGGR